MVWKGCSGAIRRCAASRCAKTCRSPTSPATRRCTAWKRPSCSTKSRKRYASSWKSGPKPPRCCAAARWRGCSTSPARGLLLSAHFAVEPQPKGATMEPMHTEQISSNVQEMPGQQEEAFQNARERLHETFATVKQRAGEACEYTEQVVRADPWSSIGGGFGVGILVGALVTLAATSRRSF